MPFFADLKTAIVINKELLDNEFVQQCYENGGSLKALFKLPEPKLENFLHRLDREMLEKNALTVLRNKLRP